MRKTIKTNIKCFEPYMKHSLWYWNEVLCASQLARLIEKEFLQNREKNDVDDQCKCYLYIKPDQTNGRLNSPYIYIMPE